MPSLSHFIKKEIKDAGFLDYSIHQAHALPKELQEAYQHWIDQGFHGKMTYLENHMDLRFNPELLLPGCKSIITVLLNYYPKEKITINDNYRIAKYAYGKDYHEVLKGKLNRIAEKCQEHFGSFGYRAFTDSAPIPDRYWAKIGGLGWIGKNTLLIHQSHGSFFFIGHLFLDITLEDTSNPIQTDQCLDCNKCLQACPTQALFAPYRMDATKCLSYQTIENKDAIKGPPPKKFRNFIYGCDICQDICPFNKSPQAHQTKEFEAHPDLYLMNKKDWETLEPMKFGEIFRGSAVKRVKYKGLKQNINWIKK